MCILLKLHYVKFYVPRLFYSKVIEEKPLGGRFAPSPPPSLGKERVKCEVHFKVSSKGVEPTKFESLDDAATFIKVLKQTIAYVHKHKKCFITRRECGAKAFLTEWLEDCQTL